jgi:hypothetical protein
MRMRKAVVSARPMLEDHCRAPGTRGTRAQLFLQLGSRGLSEKHRAMVANPRRELAEALK